MLIEGARIAQSSTRAIPQNLWINRGVISFSPAPAPGTVLNLRDFLVLPGLINAHDHLELNLFPRLGCGPYPNATAWANDIYRPAASPIKEHLAIPKSIRLLWGAIKNLLSGVSTVAQHGCLDSVLLHPSFPLRVVRRYGWAHSLTFSPDWRQRLEETPIGYPFIIHAAEGTDDATNHEIEIVCRAATPGRPLILVHGVAAGAADVPLLLKRNVSLIWCPSSNYFTLGRTLDCAVLNSEAPIALGSDSALTGDGDLLDELRAARKVTDAHRLYRMVTSEPARMLKLPAGFGQVCHTGPADLLVLRDTGQTPAAALMEQTPQMLIVGGRVRLVSSQCAHLCPGAILESLRPLTVEGRGTYFVAHDVAALVRATEEALKEDVRLAGRPVAA